MILAIDYGSRYIGLAIGTMDERISARYGVIDQKSQEAIATITGTVAKERVDTILVGVPVSLAGNETAQTEESRKFMEKLKHQLGVGVKIVGVDETLTSVEAERQIQWEGGRKEDAHAEAARLMLSDYFKRQS